MEVPMKRFSVLFLLLALALLSGCAAGDVYIPPTLTPGPGQAPIVVPTAAPSPPAKGQKVATIETNRGTILCTLRPDAAPQTVANFETLANSGFYDGHTFFRVEPGFVIQGGSPTDDATGDVGYTVPAEISLKHTAGALAMARIADSGNPTRASSGSQFYITLAAQPGLDGAYTVFGDCGGSMSVIQSIQVGDKMTKVRVETR
jgi:peptidyl-prolyl cis-trans isomerase B (cyclophilin B)